VDAVECRGREHSETGLGLQDGSVTPFRYSVLNCLPSARPWF
jgi:hypothetical protein